MSDGTTPLSLETAGRRKGREAARLSSSVMREAPAVSSNGGESLASLRRLNSFLNIADGCYQRIKRRGADWGLPEFPLATRYKIMCWWLHGAKQRQQTKKPATVLIADFLCPLGVLTGGLGRNRTTDTRIFSAHPCVRFVRIHTQHSIKSSTYSAPERSHSHSNAAKSTRFPSRASDSATENCPTSAMRPF